MMESRTAGFDLRQGQLLNEVGIMNSNFLLGHSSKICQMEQDNKIVCIAGFIRLVFCCKSAIAETVAGPPVAPEKIFQRFNLPNNLLKQEYSGVGRESVDHPNFSV